MSTSRVAPSTPFLVFVIGAVAFVAWVAHDATHAPAAPRPDQELLSPNDDPIAGPIEKRLNALQPGVPRLVAEQQLTALGAPTVEPIDVSSGKPVCRSRYLVHLVRPVPNLMPDAPGEFQPGPYTLTVEFDGGADGHPLRRLTLTRAPGAPLVPLPACPAAK
jgi:hypothetical protein